jgi:hypothetical protein
MGGIQADRECSCAGQASRKASRKEPLQFRALVQLSRLSAWPTRREAQVGCRQGEEEEQEGASSPPLQADGGGGGCRGGGCQLASSPNSSVNFSKISRSFLLTVGRALVKTFSKSRMEIFGGMTCGAIKHGQDGGGGRSCQDLHKHAGQTSSPPRQPFHRQHPPAHLVSEVVVGKPLQGQLLGAGGRGGARLVDLLAVLAASLAKVRRLPEHADRLRGRVGFEGVGEKRFQKSLVKVPSPKSPHPISRVPPSPPPCALACMSTSLTTTLQSEPEKPSVRLPSS